MHRFITLGIETAAAAVVLIPVFIMLQKLYFKNGTARGTAALAFALYLAAVYAAVGLPTAAFFRFEPVFNFVPFAGMAADKANSILNVLLFVPLGIFLPILSEKCRSFPRTLAFGFCATALIEVLQIFTFRATDINDIITNLAGTFIGYIISMLLMVIVPPLRRLKIKSSEIHILCILSFIVMFFAHPFISDFMWRQLS